MSCRPIKAATSTSCSANVRRAFPAIRTEARMDTDFANAVYPSLKDRVVFITGGGAGIGESVVEHFCAQGARVTFVDVAKEASEALVERIAGRGHRRPDYVRLDLRDIDVLHAAIERASAEHGPIRVLVNNAG